MSLEKGRISSYQILLLITNLIFSTEIQFIPAILIKYAGQDAWISVLIATILSLPIGSLLIYLGLRFPGKNPVEYSMELLGKWGGRILGLCLGLFFLYVAAIAIRSLADHLVVAVMPETPTLVFVLLFAFATAYGIYLGLEVFARVTEILFPLFLSALLLGSAFLIPQLNWNLLKPVLHHSPIELLRGSLSLLSFYGEGLAVLFLIPCMHNPRQAPALVWKVTLLFTFPFLVIVAMEIAIFGAEETSRIIFPTFELVKMISVAGFFERVEAFLLAFWVTTVSLKAALLYYAALICFAQSLNLRDHRPLVWPGAIILVSMAMLIFTDTTQTRNFLATTWNIFALSVELGIPALLLLLALFRKKGKSSLAGKNQ